MALSIFDDKSKQPKDRELAETLGKTKRLWDDLKDHVAKECAPITKEWKFYGQKYGWSFLLKRKKRTMLYLIPCKGYYMVAFVFGDRAVKAAHESNLPESIVKAINDAKRYVEGTGFRLKVESKKDLDSIRRLVTIKMAN